MTLPLNLPNSDPSLSSQTQELLDEISSVEYPSQLRGLRPKLARAAAFRTVNVSEINIIIGALDARRGNLVASDAIEPPEDIPDFLSDQKSAPVQLEL